MMDYESEEQLIESVAKTIASASGMGWQDVWDEDEGQFYKEVAKSIIFKVRQRDRAEAVEKVMDAIEGVTGSRP